MRYAFAILLLVGCSESPADRADYLRRQYVTECTALTLMQRNEDVVKSTAEIPFTPGGDRAAYDTAIAVWRLTQSSRLERLNILTTEQMARIEQLEQRMESASRP